MPIERRSFAIDAPMFGIDSSVVAAAAFVAFRVCDFVLGCSDSDDDERRALRTRGRATFAADGLVLRGMV